MMESGGDTALILSGGAAYGAFAVGILKALFAGRSPSTGYQPFETNIISGTSVGAFNAAAMVACDGSSLEAAEHLSRVWTDLIAARPGRCGNGIYRIRGDLRDYFDPTCTRSGNALRWLANDSWEFTKYFVSRTANFLADSGPLDDRVAAAINIGSFIDVTPMRNLIHTIIDEADIRASSKRINVTATDWVTGEPKYFVNEDFHDELGFDAVLASAAVPGVFPPVRIGNHIYVDGGVVQNTPLEAAIEMGASELHVVYLDPAPRFVPLQAQPNTLDTMLRMYYAMLATKISEDIETARWINRGLELVAGYREIADAHPLTVRDFVRVAAKLMEVRGRPYRKLTVHRYFPRQYWNSDLGMLDFDLEQMLNMMQEGERVAITHDCSENACVL